MRRAVIDNKYVIEMEEYSVGSLIECVEKALKLSKEQEGKERNILKKEDSLSYEEYGKRYNAFIYRIVRNDKLSQS